MTTRLLVKPSPARSAQFFPPGGRQALGEEMKVDGVWCVKRIQMLPTWSIWVDRFFLPLVEARKKF